MPALAPRRIVQTTPFPDSVLIIGAGPAGLSMAAALADIGIASTVLEQAPLAAIAQPQEDGREIALTHRGVGVLQQLGAWQDLPPEAISPLKAAQVFNGQDARFLGFTPEGQGTDRLGHLVPNHWLRQIAYQGVMKRPDLVRLRCSTRVQKLHLLAQGGRAAELVLEDGERLSAPLVIAADSRFSASRRLAGIGADMLDFGRSVILCRMHHELPHQHTALECFHHGHTMAWLPLQEHLASLVLTVNADEAQSLLDLDDAAFLDWVQTHSQGRLGALRLAGPRHFYPLVATYARRFVARRFALIGDAAVGMHPVTAHGYNFGLYGVQTLARELQMARRHRAGCDLGDAVALERFEREHRRATRPIYLGTNAVVKLFTDERPLARALRQGVLQGAAHLPPLKALISQQLTGKGPSLLRQIRSLAG